MGPNEHEIHQAVKEYYGAIATTKASSCCEPQEPCCDESERSSLLYDLELLESAPDEAAAISLGCGDPVTLASLQPGEVVLDLGSGGGLDCFLAAKAVGEDGRVIGVDMTEAMIARANASKEKLGLRNVEFHFGQIEDIPLDSEIADVVMSNCVINLSPNKDVVFREAYRVLKRGGRISVSDIVTEGEFSVEARSDLQSWAGCVAGAIDVQEYLAKMREAGFVEVELKESIKVGAADGGPKLFSARIWGRKPD